MTDANTDNDGGFISTAMKRWKMASDAEDVFRPEALDDAKFSIGQQWPEEIQQQRILSNRPCLTVDQTGPYIRQITNDQRQNRPSLKITATDEHTEDTAEAMEGIVRHIQAQSDADIAYDTACDCQVRNGFGYFRVLTEYCQNDQGKITAQNFANQDIKIKRIKNPFTVYFDPGAIEPDYSDAKWCFIVSDILKEDFKDSYPEAETASYDLTSIGDMPAGWMTEDYIRIAEYFLVKETPVKLYLISDGQQAIVVKSIKDTPMGWAVLKERDSTERKVKWYKITAFEKLEEKEWAGIYIPIIPVLGEDLDIDGKRSLRGLVRSMKDPQRMYNYWTTAATEAIALAPKAPWIIAAGQLKGFEKYWESANTASWSHLPYNIVQGAPPPQRNQYEPPVLAMTGAIKQAADDLSRVTGIFKEGLGAQTNAQSGKAIIARQREGDVSTFHFQDNLARGIKHLGRVLLDLIPKIYDTARIMRILHEDGTAKTQKINQEGGIDLSQGEYDVAVNVGPSYTTKRQEAADSMTQIVQAYPAIMQQAGDIIVHNMDFPGAHQLADRLKMFLPPNIQEEDDGKTPLPPEVQQKMGQMQQMVQALSEQLHKTLDIVEGKKVEADSKERMNTQNNLTKLQVAAIGKESDANLAFAQAQIARAEGLDAAHQSMVQAEHQQAITPPPPPPGQGTPSA